MPNEESTLFVCSGMQLLKDRFQNPDMKKHGSLQSCIRTNDLDLVGDGIHLTYFEMLGNFSFGRNDFEESIEIWHQIITELKLPVTHITVHPQKDDHKNLWIKRKYEVVSDSSNIWSDGEIGGYCCEVFINNLEIGNLVNTLGHSTDVGFGWERVCQIIEHKDRVDETSLFDLSMDYVERDHVRTLIFLIQNNIMPGPKGRNFICRKLMRRVLNSKNPLLKDCLMKEKDLRDGNIQRASKYYKKHGNKTPEFWKDTFGILPEELHMIG